MTAQERHHEPTSERSAPMSATVDWRLPAGQRDDWLFGTGATGIEQGLVWVGGLLGLGLIVWQGVVAPPAGWAWWHYLLSAVIVLDVAGGAVANALGTAKRLYFAPLREPASRWTRLLHNHLGFTALHLHPLVIAALYPGAHIWWGVLWYLVALLGVLAVRLSPLYLARPVAMLVFTAAMLLQSVIAAPVGWAWFVPVFLAKLVLAHAVREEPYRPDRNALQLLEVDCSLRAEPAEDADGFHSTSRFACNLEVQ